MKRPLADKRPFGPIFGQRNNVASQTQAVSKFREQVGFKDGKKARMYFKNSTNMDEVGDGEAALVATSPPYNVDYDYGDINDRKEYENYLSGLAEVFLESQRKLMPEGRLCINVPSIIKPSGKVGEGNIPVASDLIQMLDSTRELMTPDIYDSEIRRLHHNSKFRLYDIIVWHKGRFGNDMGLASLGGGRGRPFRFEQDITHESILVFQKDGKRDIKSLPDAKIEASSLPNSWWEFEETDGESDMCAEQTTNKSSIWRIDPDRQNPVIVNGLKTPVQPIEIPRRLIEAYSFVGDLVVDPYAGLGTTLLAAKDTDRLGIGYELREELEPGIRDRVGEITIQ
jgi:DNA modification methylase